MRKMGKKRKRVNLKRGKQRETDRKRRKRGENAEMTKGKGEIYRGERGVTKCGERRGLQ